MSKAADLKRALNEAREYIGKIGAAQPHYREPESVGRLHKLDVKTEINHQATSGGTNYWNCKEFDSALGRIIAAKFPELAADALELMTLDYAAARIAEKDSLLAQLAEIEALEAAK